MNKILALSGLLIMAAHLTECQGTFSYKKNLADGFYIVEDEMAAGKSIFLQDKEGGWQGLITGHVVYVLGKKSQILIGQKKDANSWAYYYLINVSETKYIEDILEITETEFYIIKDTLKGEYSYEF